MEDGKMNDTPIINHIFSFFLTVIGYTFVLFVTDYLFNSLYVEELFYDFVAALIICILNKTIKPFIFKITIPITAITFGLFYPFINLFILKITDWILGNKFDVYGIWWGLLVAIMISIINFLVDDIFINPIKRRYVIDE